MLQHPTDDNEQTTPIGDNKEIPTHHGAENGNPYGDEEVSSYSDSAVACTDAGAVEVSTSEQSIADDEDYKQVDTSNSGHSQNVRGL